MHALSPHVGDHDMQLRWLLGRLLIQPKLQAVVCCGYSCSYGYCSQLAPASFAPIVLVFRSRDYRYVGLKL